MLTGFVQVAPFLFTFSFKSCSAPCSNLGSNGSSSVHQIVQMLTTVEAKIAYKGGYQWRGYQQRRSLP
jgi:hypothetical protein